MHLQCLQVMARFPAERLQLSTSEPVEVLWDCHHADVYVLKVGGLAVEELPEETPESSIRLKLTLSPPGKLIQDIERFAATMQLALEKAPRPQVKEKLLLAACHVPSAKLFVFSEDAVLTAQASGPQTWDLEVAGPFKSRRVPCQEADLVIHLGKEASTRLLSQFFHLVRAQL